VTSSSRFLAVSSHCLRFLLEWAGGVLSANGENERARAAAAAIDADRLTTGEYGLLAPLRAIAP